MDPRFVRWDQAWKKYHAALRAAGRSAGTIRLHRYYVWRLADVVQRPFRVTVGELLEFLAVEHWKPETRKSARGVVASFYRWAYGAGLVEDDISQRLPAVHVPPAVARPTPEHLVRVLTRQDGRVGFMAMLAGFGGLRAGEIARVHGRDLVEDVLLVTGKGGVTRHVPIVHEELLGRLASVGDRWVFPNGRGSHLSPGHVTRLLSRAMPPGWTAHTLRHRAATTAYAGTRDLLAVGALLGHSRPETTQRYVRMPDDSLRAAARAASVA